MDFYDHASPDLHRLLQAIANGNAVVPGVPTQEIELYDMDSFRPLANTSGNRYSNQFARSTARDCTTSNQGTPSVDVAAEIFQRSTEEIERQKGKEARDKFVSDPHRRIERPRTSAFSPQARRRTRPTTGPLHGRVMPPLMQRAERRSGSSQSRTNSFNENPLCAVLASFDMANTRSLDAVF